MDWRYITDRTHEPVTVIGTIAMVASMAVPRAVSSAVAIALTIAIGHFYFKGYAHCRRPLF